MERPPSSGLFSVRVWSADFDDGNGRVRLLLRFVGFRSQRPLDSAEEMRLISLGRFDRIFALGQIGIGINEVFAMTKRGVEHFSFAVILAPGNAKMSGGVFLWM